MFYDTLNTEEQVSYLIKPIIEVLQEVGGQLERAEIKDRISENDEKIAEFEQFSRVLLTKMGVQFTDKGIKISIDGNDLVRLVIKYELYITPVTTYVLDDFYDEE